MTQSIYDKWSSITESLGITGSKVDCMKEYMNNQSLFENEIVSEDSKQPFFPLATKIAAKTIGVDLVAVKPMSSPGGNSSEEIDRIKNEVKSTNRNNKIESIIENKEYKEMDIKDHPDYKGGIGNLFYMDYKYSGSTSSTNP